MLKKGTQERRHEDVVSICTWSKEIVQEKFLCFKVARAKQRITHLNAHFKYIIVHMLMFLVPFSFLGRTILLLLLLLFSLLRYADVSMLWVDSPQFVSMEQKLLKWKPSGYWFERVTGISPTDRSILFRGIWLRMARSGLASFVVVGSYFWAVDHLLWRLIKRFLELVNTTWKMPIHLKLP